MRSTPLLRGRGAKAKGSRAEAELTALLREIGFDARRNFASGGQGGGDILGVPDHSIECKRCETVRIWDWLLQARAAARSTEIPAVVFRRSRSPWFVAVPAEDYFGMVKELQELRGQ